MGMQKLQPLSIKECLNVIIDVEIHHANATQDGKLLLSMLINVMDSIRSIEQLNESNEEEMLIIYFLLERFKKTLISERECMKIMSYQQESFYDTIKSANSYFNQLKSTIISGNYDGVSTQPDKESNNEKPKYRRANYPKQVSLILKTWLRRNIENPYPYEKEKAMLASQTGLDHTQINNWFINARRRVLPNLRRMFPEE